MPFSDWTFPADAVRPLSAIGPFRVASGRAIVDSLGRVIARCEAMAQLDADGRIVPCGLSPTQADGNAHAIARMLNAATEEPSRDVAGFIANLKSAIWNRETVSIGGGQFSGDELRAVLAALAEDGTHGR